MPLKDILFGGSGIIFILMTLIQVTPIKINPWSTFFAWLGRAFNKDLIQKIVEIDKKVDKLEKTVNFNEAQACRTKILRFNDELLTGKEFTKSHFDNILIQIDKYQKFCDENKDFQNSIIDSTIENIKATYRQLLMTHGFLHEGGDY